MAQGIENIKVNLNTAVKAVEDEIEKVLRQFLEKLKTDADSEIRKAKAYASGQTMKNLRYEITREVGRITGVMGVGANVPHAIFAHEGSKPHWPPQLAIQQWIIQKGFVKRNNRPVTRGFLKRHLNKAQGIEAVSEIRNIAFLIARKISQKGTSGLPFLKIALNLNRSFLMEKLSAIKV